MKLLRDPKILLTTLCGVALVLSFFNFHPWLPYLSVLFGSYFALKSAWGSLVDREIDVNFLMVLAAAGAVAVRQPIDAAALLFLFSLSSTLESLAMARTRSAIEGLIKLRPDKAILVSDKGETAVAVEELELGDRIKVPPFEPIPVDGIILEGSSSIDQSAMTGESVPVHKGPGEKLIGGTRNLDNCLILEVGSRVGDSALDKIVALVQDAQDNKASGERISAWFGQKYTFFVIFVFVASLAVRLFLGEQTSSALYASLTLLVALSPCAMVISTPATTLSALAWCARNGVLVRGGEFIEKAGRIDVVALDKTGTLTHGKPKLVEICVCAKSMSTVGAGSNGCTDEDSCWHGDEGLSPVAQRFLAYAASAEQYSAHPIAEALREAARRSNLSTPLAQEETAFPGLGVRARIEGQSVLVGQTEFLEDQGVKVAPRFKEHVSEFQRKGMSVALIAIDDEVAALGFMDTPRAEARDFLDQLKHEGVKEIYLLSGDNPKTAAATSQSLGIDRFEGGLMPADKAERIQKLTSSGQHVMMVGDGINDAPPITAATIGVAMGGLGSDIALNAADVVLMHDRLDRIPQLMQIGRKTNRIIRANLIFAVGVIAVLTVFSLFGKLPLPLAVLGHEGSTVLVILNGMRLLRGP